MQTTTSIQGFGSIPGDISLEELYDLIMGKIEPDLIAANLPTLDEKYKNETPEEKKARGLRYAEAFALFEQTFATLMHAWEDNASSYRSDVIVSSKKTSAVQDSKDLDAIGDFMNAA